VTIFSQVDCTSVIGTKSFSFAFRSNSNNSAFKCSVLALLSSYSGIDSLVILFLTFLSFLLGASILSILWPADFFFNSSRIVSLLINIFPFASSIAVSFPLLMDIYIEWTVTPSCSAASLRLINGIGDVTNQLLLH